MNGTRQDSVLSPYLFCIFMRDTSGTIAKSNHIAGIPINILSYADDLVLLAPSWRAHAAAFIGYVVLVLLLN